MTEKEKLLDHLMEISKERDEFDRTFKIEQERPNPMQIEGYSGLVDEGLYRLVPESRTGMSINVLRTTYESRDLKEILGSKLKDVDVHLLLMLQRFKALVARLQAFCIQISKFHKVFKLDYGINRILDLKISDLAINPTKFSRMDIERLNEPPVIEVQTRNPLNPAQIDFVKKKSTGKPFFDLSEIRLLEDRTRQHDVHGRINKEAPVSESGLEILSKHFPENIELFIESFRAVEHLLITEHLHESFGDKRTLGQSSRRRAVRQVHRLLRVDASHPQRCVHRELQHPASQDGHRDRLFSQKYQPRCRKLRRQQTLS